MTNRDALSGDQLTTVGETRAVAYQQYPGAQYSRRPSKRGSNWPWVFFAVSFLLAGGITVAYGLGYRSLAGIPVLGDLPVIGGEPMTVEAAEAVAQKYFDRSATGDVGGAWDLLSKRGKATHSRIDALRYQQACPGEQQAGWSVVITDVRMDGADRAVMTVKVWAFTVSAIAVYEDGAWRYDPDDKQLVKMAKPVEQQIRDDKADGSCRRPVEQLPSCSEVFVAGKVIDAEEATGCRARNGERASLVAFRCPEGKTLYQIDTSSGAPKGWGVTGEMFHTVKGELWNDRGYMAAQDHCSG